jgi:diguanylate cyclase (GGDEF)-like protein/PAS domain S-box-containing protein
VLADALRLGPDTVLLLDPSTGRIHWVSDRIVELAGWQPDQLVGRQIHEFDTLIPTEPDHWRAMVEGLRPGAVAVFDGRIRCRDGTHRALEVRFTLTDPGGRRYLVASAREVEARTRVEARLRERESTLTAVISALRDGVIVVDAGGLVTMANPRAAELAGRSIEGLLHRPVHEALGVTPEACPLGPTLATGEPSSDLIRSTPGDRTQWLLVNTAPIVDPTSGEIRGAVATNADITDLIRAQSELEELASRDVLTGLANRARFHDRLRAALAAASRTTDHLGLLFVDLDGFKRVNDSLGHSHGDDLLQQAARRIADQLRPDDFVARIGGDEFVIMLPRLGPHPARAEAVATEVAARAIAATEQPFELSGQVIRISASIGIALGTPGAARAEELLRQADLAMYAAKHGGGVAHRVFDERMDLEAQRALRLDGDLRHAIEHHELALHLQPRLDVATGALTGAEALLRWRHQHPSSPDTASIVATAERNGLIVPLGRWVLEEAVSQAAELRRAGVLRPGMTLSVNISGHQLREDDFVTGLVQILERAGLPPELLTVELTESALLADLYQARRQLSALERVGVALSIDDFGTGYSSLAYLRELPVRELKIDRLFVADLGRDPTAEVIVRGVLDIARGIGLETVAEGVERQEQLDVLRTTPCSQYQGYLTSAAIALPEFLSRYGR